MVQTWQNWKPRKTQATQKRNQPNQSALSQTKSPRLSEHSNNRNIKTQNSWFEKQNNTADSRLINKSNNRQASRVKMDYNAYSPNVKQEQDSTSANNRHGNLNRIKYAISPTRDMIQKDKATYKMTSNHTSKFAELKTTGTERRPNHYESMQMHRTFEYD